LDEQNLAEIRSPEYPGERLVVCHNPLLEQERRRKRQELLAATEKALEKIRRQVERRKHKPMQQAEIGLKDYTRANHDLQQELPGAQRAGVRFGLARIYYLLGTSARLSGSSGIAADYYHEAAQLLEVIRGDSGAENMMRRTDFKTMYDESNRWKK